jgi:hypothetical protein
MLKKILLATVLSIGFVVTLGIGSNRPVTGDLTAISGAGSSGHCPFGPICESYQ